MIMMMTADDDDHNREDTRTKCRYVGMVMGWTDGVQFPGMYRLFSLPKRLDRHWGPPNLLSDLYPWVKWLGRKCDHKHATSAEVKKAGAIPPLPHTFL
jgi:hypothetical protein